jgi:hypothetical protein
MHVIYSLAQSTKQFKVNSIQMVMNPHNMQILIFKYHYKENGLVEKVASCKDGAREVQDGNKK